MATKTELGVLRSTSEYPVEPIEYPTEDGEPMPGGLIQQVPVWETIGALKAHYSAHPDVFVWGDMFIYHREGDPSAVVAPNVFVVLDARDNPERNSWFTWVEGTGPDFVLEVATRTTWRRDATEKRDTYATLGIAEYWRFDPTGEFFAAESADRLRLIGERLVEGRYQPIPLAYDPDEVTLRGHSDVLGLDICVLPGMDGDPTGSHIRCYDPVTGWLRNRQEERQARVEEAEARREAEAENERLRQELARLRGGGSSD